MHLKRIRGVHETILFLTPDNTDFIVIPFMISLMVVELEMNPGKIAISKEMFCYFF
jgi:hypothetical protein